jgi:hypothetical protein
MNKKLKELTMNKEFWKTLLVKTAICPIILFILCRLFTLFIYSPVNNE